MRTWCLHAISGSLEDFHCVGTKIGSGLSRDLRNDPLTGQRMPHEDHASICRMGNTATPRGDCTRHHLHQHAHAIDVVTTAPDPPSPSQSAGAS